MGSDNFLSLDHNGNLDSLSSSDMNPRNYNNTGKHSRDEPDQNEQQDDNSRITNGKGPVRKLLKTNEHDSSQKDIGINSRPHQNTPSLPAFNFTKFCYRHNPEIQNSPTHTACYNQDLKKVKEINYQISKLPIQEQSEIHHMISKFNKSNDKIRKLIFDGLLASSCFPQLSYVSTQVQEMLKIDFISILPKELSSKILSYLDCQSLCNSMLVCHKWNSLANNDRIWYHMCKQHIDRKCPNCGWGLPLMQMKNNFRNRQRKKEDQLIKNPWKVIYRDRFKVELNWRRGNFTIKDFKGHMDGILSLQHNYRLLFTGSYDSTVAIWDIHSGKLVRRLQGHSDGVKALYFDDQKLITGSLDKTIRIWNYVTGECISTYRGHTDSVMSIDSFKKIIVSGSADKTVKVWHIETRTCYTLRGHTEWVNCVRLHPNSFSCYSCSDDGTIRMWDIRTNSCLKIFRGHVGQVQKVIPLTIIDIENLVTDKNSNACTGHHSGEAQETTEDSQNVELDENIPYPTHILSCSLDNTIKLWNIKTGQCIRTHFGHVEGVWDIAADNFRIISGSHDGTIKIWDLQSGKCMHTFQGRRLEKDDHLRPNSNNTNDEENNNEQLTNKVSPITCVAIGDSEFFCGDEMGCCRMFNFENGTDDNSDD
ncbi:ubiquitin-binding SDF ubiquitin ligase complex subunit met30 [Maudiozyma exigua]|uniref:Ubiquitin-binding SDF ubiquitin ligase complex subunit met30 n=1 Tax=Maudiozyma exigua TaxID=34358 RepID=A0A9P6WE65_MAUEX|nr:ubiquitin-binding SDF ubiquitin ligase complex subunit met30 [Kazachstania exigua]